MLGIPKLKTNMLWAGFIVAAFITSYITKDPRYVYAVLALIGGWLLIFYLNELLGGMNEP